MNVVLIITGALGAEREVYCNYIRNIKKKCKRSE